MRSTEGALEGRLDTDISHSSLLLAGGERGGPGDGGGQLLASAGAQQSRRRRAELRHGRQKRSGTRAIGDN